MIIHAESKSLLLKLKDPEKVKHIFPKYKDINFSGHNLAVPFRLDEVKILRNIGIKAPSPIGTFYEWSGNLTPFTHQRETAEFLTIHNRCFLLSGLGSGKTKSCLWAADYLLNEGKIKKVLIVSPLSTLESVWGDEIFRTLPHRNAVVVHGSREKRHEILKNDVEFYIINHDGLHTIAKAAIGMKFDLTIVDEAGEYRNAKSRRYKSLEAVLNPATRLWLVTATPTPKSPVDAWALARLVNPQAVPKFIGAWQTQTMNQLSTYRWVPKKDAQDIVYKVLQPAIRFRTEDCIDLPPITHTTLTCEMTPEQRKVYNAIKEDMMHEDETAGYRITAVNAAVRMLKLVQVAAGVVRGFDENEEDSVITIEPTNRLRALSEAIEAVPPDQKVIVFVPFRGVLSMVKDYLEKEHTVEVIHGGVEANKRREIFSSFQHQRDPRILLAIPRAMSHGLNLTSASTVVWYAGIWDAGIYEQANGRVARPGQKNHMNIVHISGTEVEKEMFTQLTTKIRNQEGLLNLYRKLFH